MTMYASFRGADGSVLGSVPIDPTRPGGMQSELADAVQRLQHTGNLPTPARPMQPMFLPPGPPQPVSQSRPFVCQLRYLQRAANGQLQWATRAINCPVGLPPGDYIHTPR